MQTESGKDIGVHYVLTLWHIFWKEILLFKVSLDKFLFTLCLAYGCKLIA